MPENVSDTPLSVKQQKFIQALLAGNSILASAKIAGVAEKTAHAWLKSTGVQTAYRAAQHAAFDEALSSLMTGVDDAIKTLRTIMSDSETPAPARVKAAQILLERAIDVHSTSILKEQVAELMQALKELKP